MSQDMDTKGLINIFGTTSPKLRPSTNSMQYNFAEVHQTKDGILAFELIFFSDSELLCWDKNNCLVLEDNILNADGKNIIPIIRPLSEMTKSEFDFVGSFKEATKGKGLADLETSQILHFYYTLAAQKLDIFDWIKQGYAISQNQFDMFSKLRLKDNTMTLLFK